MCAAINSPMGAIKDVACTSAEAIETRGVGAQDAHTTASRLRQNLTTLIGFTTRQPIQVGSSGVKKVVMCFLATITVMSLFFIVLATILGKVQEQLDRIEQKMK